MARPTNTNTEKKTPTTSAKWWYDQYTSTDCAVRKAYCLSQIIAFCAKHPESANAAHNTKSALKLLVKGAADALAALDANPAVLATVREGKGGAALREANNTIAALNARIAELEAKTTKAKTTKAKAAPKAKADEDVIG